MVRRFASSPLWMLLLGISLALQAAVGCDVAHAKPVMSAAGHCEEMAMNADSGRDGSPIQHSDADVSHDCAKICHPVAAQSGMPYLATGVVHTQIPDTQRLDDLTGNSIRPAIPPPRKI